MKNKSDPEKLVADAMARNSGDNARVNVPGDYAQARWDVRDPPSLLGLKVLLLAIAQAGDDVRGTVDLPAALVRQVPGLARAVVAEIESVLDELVRLRVRADDVRHGNARATLLGSVVRIARIEWADDGSGGARFLGAQLTFGEVFISMVETGNLYAVLDASAVLAMRSRHSVLLYQHLAAFFRKRDKVLVLSLDEIRSVFALQAGEYAEFKRLNSKVIQSACAEISENSEYLVTAKPEYRGGRKAVGVRFEWKPKAEAEPPAAGSPPTGGKQKSRKGGSVSSSPPSVSDAQRLQLVADRVKQGKPYLVGDVSAASCRAMLGNGLVTEADLSAVGLRW